MLIPFVNWIKWDEIIFVIWNFSPSFCSGLRAWKCVLGLWAAAAMCCCSVSISAAGRQATSTQVFVVFFNGPQKGTCLHHWNFRTHFAGFVLGHISSIVQTANGSLHFLIFRVEKQRTTKISAQLASRAWPSPILLFFSMTPPHFNSCKLCNYLHNQASESTSIGCIDYVTNFYTRLIPMHFHHYD